MRRRTRPGGKGLSPPVLNLLPGWGYRASVWEGLIARLGPGWAPNPVELPWEYPPARWLAPDGPLAARLRPGWCLGWSFGGSLALALAEAGVGGIPGVVLLASTPCWVAAPDWAAGLETEAIAELRAQVEDDPEAALRHFNALAALGAKEPGRVRGALAHHLLTRTEGPALAAALALMLRLDARVLPPRLAVRVIEGEGDRLLPAGIDPAWLAANDIRRHRLPRSGHAPLVADPAAVAATLAASGAGAEHGG